MPVVTYTDVARHLNLPEPGGYSEPDENLERIIVAAQGHIERLLGFRIEATYPTDVPPALVQAVCLLVGHWYENREGTLVGTSASHLPFGVWDIVNEYREYSFGG